MWRKVCFVIIVIGLVFSVSDYYFRMNDSYNKYLSGEYYFREKARTLGDDNDYAFLNPDAPQPDYSDPKAILLLSSGARVYAYGPHNGVCTVISGDNVIRDFPLNRLKLENEDTDYFYGKKQYTYDEYIDRLKELTKEQLDSPLVSDRKMAGFLKVKEFMIILVCADAAVFALLFLFYKHELDFGFDLFLVLGALYSIFFDMVCAFAF